MARYSGLCSFVLEMDWYFELKMQYIMIKKTIPLCLLRKDSVKNKLIIRIPKEIATKFLDFIVFIKFIAAINKKSRMPKIPNSAKNCMYWL